MDYIEVTGKTVEDARTEALIKLGTTSDQIEVEVVEKGSSGFLGIGSKPAVIRVRKKFTIEDCIKENKTIFGRSCTIYHGTSVVSYASNRQYDPLYLRP